MTFRRRSVAVLAVFTLALGLAACGDDGTAEDDMENTDMEAPDMTMPEDETDGAMDGMDMSESEGMEGMGDMEGMDMGDPDATPAYDVEGADLVQGDFTLLDGAPDGFADATGTAYLARGEMTTATLEVTGLQADTPYVSHVHAESCDTAGGPHFKYDPDGGDTPPNEIHLGFTTDADGNGAMTATNDMVAGPDAVSIVIHQADGDQTKALCADLG